MLLTAKTIGMLIGPGYEELEHWVPYMRMKEEGARVIVIGESAGQTYMGKHGCYPARSEAAAAEIQADTLDGLLIPGGYCPDTIRRSQPVLELIRAAHAQGKIIGMICHAGSVGISAGIIGRRATGSLGIKDDLVLAGAQWVDEPAFREGNIVWGRVVEDIPRYTALLVQTLAG